MRFHVISLPHTQTTKDYVICAFTEKVRRFCMMMKDQGHTVYLYASEQVSIIRQSSIKSAVELMSSWTAKEEKKYNPQQLVELTLLAAAEFEKWVMRDESKG